MSDETATAALAEAARSLDEAARMHKRSEFAHRRHARLIRKQLADLEAACAQVGIRLTILEGEGGRKRHGQHHVGE